jgi:hypothetical protein
MKGKIAIEILKAMSDVRGREDIERLMTNSRITRDIHVGNRVYRIRKGIFQGCEIKQP